MSELPTGTVTLLFSDVEGSTRHLLTLGPQYEQALADHRRLLRDAFARAGGREVNTQGDSFLVAFTGARDALAAAVDGQRSLAAHTWPGDRPLRVRMGIHTGEPVVREGDYVGLDVHRAARISAAAHGGQVLVSAATRQLLGDEPLPDVRLQDLGEHLLKDLPAPERLSTGAARRRSTTPRIRRRSSSRGKGAKGRSSSRSCGRRSRSATRTSTSSGSS